MSIVKRITHVLIVVLTLVVGATAAALIVSQTAWFKNWLRGYIIREANTYLNGTLSIERLGGKGRGYADDNTSPELVLDNVQNPVEVRELIRKAVLEERARRGLTYREVMR